MIELKLEFLKEQEIFLTKPRYFLDAGFAIKNNGVCLFINRLTGTSYGVFISIRDINLFDNFDDLVVFESLSLLEEDFDYYFSYNGEKIGWLEVFEILDASYKERIKDKVSRSERRSLLEQFLG